VKTTRLQRVRIASARVALVTTAIVAAVYVLIAFVVVLLVQRNLTADIDNRLLSSLSQFNRSPERGGGGYHEPPGGPRFAAPLIVWTVHSNGTVSSTDSEANLPAAYQRVGSPQTVTIGDTDVRLAGTQIGRDYVVVGQTMDSVATARSTLVIAEVIVGPILLAAVFLGAFTIGRRVGAPIELARQRQMEFTADASHELRTPLAVIEAQATLALSHDRENDWYRKAFRSVDTESRRMRQLVEDLLWLARFDAKGGPPNAEHVDVGVLAQQAVERFGTLAEARNVALGFRVSGDAHVITAPPDWLDNLVGVLLDNACKYSPANGEVDVVVSSEPSRVRLTVDDSGPGIPTEEREHIFDRFHRATDLPGGAGLGLAIADAVVKATNGRWDVGRSTAGGASMSVSWPRALGGPREASSATAPASPSTRHAKPEEAST
jgi:signal transduction histidine kinase